MVCCQGESSRKGHKVSRQNNYRVRHEKWALPGTSRRCATYSPPRKYIPSSEYYGLYQPVRINLLFQIKQKQLQLSVIDTTLLQRTFII